MLWAMAACVTARCAGSLRSGPTVGIVFTAPTPADRRHIAVVMMPRVGLNHESDGAEAAVQREAVPRLVTDSEPCPEHGRRPWEHDRQSASARGYGARWRKLRAFVLQRDDYLCQSCRRAGRLAPAASVDHVTPKFLGGSDDPDNLTSLCDRCRADKDARDAAEGRRRGRR